MDKNKNITMEKLAIMIGIGFENVDARFNKVDDRLDGVDNRLDKVENRLGNIDDRLDHVDRRLATIETDISEIRKNFVYREEIEDLMARVKYLEVKLGVESGK